MNSDMAVYAYAHPEEFEDAAEAAVRFVSRCLSSVHISPRRNPSLVVEDYNEWRHIALCFLWEGLSRYDPAKGIPLYYLLATVRGGLLRTIRETSVPVHMTRKDYFSGKFAHQVSLNTPLSADSTLTLEDSLEAPDIAEIVAIQEDSLETVSAFLALQPPMVEAVIAQWLNGDTPREISQHLGISVQLVNKMVVQTGALYATWKSAK